MMRKTTLVHLATLMCVAGLVFGVPGPSKDGGAGRVYHGMIREDAQEGAVVELDTPLFDGQIKDKVCGYTVFKSGAIPVPFQVVLGDAKTGRAQIVLAKGQKLNYELTSKYEFDVATDDCATGAHSAIRDRVHIEVEDVNDFAPTWREPSYMIEAVEGILYKRLLKLEAIDGDGTETFSKICRYSLLTTGVPFKIDVEGYIQNTEPMDYSIKHNYILEVEAEDCGHKRSGKLLVNIVVKPECKIGWQGVENSIDYAPVSGRQDVASNASLELCGATCAITQVTARFKLITLKESSVCPVDARSIEARNKICGSSRTSVELLSGVPLSSDADGFAFDGKTVAYEIPAERFSNRLLDQFSVSTWLKHEQQSADAEEKKQHILCNADGEGMNRHHSSIFLHNCRLILLLRQEPGLNVDMNVFKPAEWRWKLPEVCDGTWHHYTVTVEFPEVRLYVDGKMFVATKHNPTIVDDWPLHPSRKATSMRLVVGACWEGGDHHFSQHLVGHLAGLTIVNNDTESDQVVQCINNCHEKLDFHAIAEMESGMSISMNSEMTQLSINGHNKESVEKLVRRIGYVNSRSGATLAGNTLITMETDITCADGSNLSVASANTVVNLMSHQTTAPTTLTVSGSAHVSREEHDVVRGVSVFFDLMIYLQSTNEATVDDSSEKLIALSERTVLDSCVIHVEPQLSTAVERFQYPVELTLKLKLDVEPNPFGLAFSGAGKASDYVDVLREVRYEHDAPEELRVRNFTLMCSELDGLSSSNQLVVELSVIHTNRAPVEPGHAISSNQLHQEVNLKEQSLKTAAGLESAGGISDKGLASSSGAGMAILVVVCVGFLLFTIVVGVLRIRTAHHRTVEVNIEEKQEMEWDNSALTITVNPMEREATYDETEMNGLQGGGGGGDETDTDDEIGSFHDEGPDTSDEETNKEKEDKGLEWDSTTATY